MSSNLGFINTPNLNFCLSSSKTQVQQFKKDVSNGATKDSIMNAHNKNQLTYASINCAIKDSSCYFTFTKGPQAHNTHFKCKFKLNKGNQMPSQQR